MRWREEVSRRASREEREPNVLRAKPGSAVLSAFFGPEREFRLLWLARIDRGSPVSETRTLLTSMVTSWIQRL